jgi:hypothetical protein
VKIHEIVLRRLHNQQLRAASCSTRPPIDRPLETYPQEGSGTRETCLNRKLNSAESKVLRTRARQCETTAPISRCSPSVSILLQAVTSIKHAASMATIIIHIIITGKPIVNFQIPAI